MTSDTTIDYEALTQDAMRSVVRAVLTRAAEQGLPGNHHFFISFDTQAPGVIVSKRLKDSPKYQNEMTIVLQHRFWGLAVSDEKFEVKLTFDGIPERLVVPFKAIKVFFDPSVRYGLQFEDADQTLETAGDAMANEETGPDDPTSDDGRVTTTRSQGPRKPRAARKPRAEREPAPAGGTPPPARLAPATATPSAATRTSSSATPPPTAATAASVPSTAPPVAVKPQDVKTVETRSPDGKPADSKTIAPAAAGAQIVSLDQFRKK